METKLQQEISKVLKNFPDYWDNDTLLKNKLIQDIREYDENIIEALLSNELIKATYSLQFSSGLVFKLEDFVSMLRFRNYWDNSYTKYTNEVGLTTEGKYLKYNTDVVLDFPHKDSVLEGGMSKEEISKKEIYYHNLLAKEEIDVMKSPKILTNIKKYNKEGNHDITEFKSTDNLILKGNNYIVLHTLKERYSNKVKLIYIDPPYNTGDDEFKYNDTFNHSTWLTFMKNRLEVARDLLRSDGVIAIQISDKEYGYLKVMCDEIFGRNCFRSSICVKMAHLSGPKMAHKEKKIPKVKEHILIYSKEDKDIKIKPQYIPSSWEESLDRYKNYIEKNGHESDYSKWTSISLTQAMKNEKINIEDDLETEKFKIDNAKLIFQTAINRSKNYPKEPKNQFLLIDDKFILNGRELIFAEDKIKDFNGVRRPSNIISDMWDDIGINNVFKEGGKDISLRFGKKPEMLIKRLISLFTNENDLVLDFFMGTATTPATAHKMKRQYIGVEQLDYIKTLSIPRLENVTKGEQSGVSKEVKWQGGGSFVYAELHSLNEEYVNKIQTSQDSNELNRLLQEMRAKAYLNFKVDLEKMTSNNSGFLELSLQEQKDVLIQVLDMNQLYLNYSEIEDSQYEIPDSVKAFNHSFYQKEGETDE